MVEDLWLTFMAFGSSSWKNQKLAQYLLQGFLLIPQQLGFSLNLKPLVDLNYIAVGSFCNWFSLQQVQPGFC